MNHNRHLKPDEPYYQIYTKYRIFRAFLFKHLKLFQRAPDIYLTIPVRHCLYKPHYDLLSQNGRSSGCCLLCALAERLSIKFSPQAHVYPECPFIFFTGSPCYILRNTMSTTDILSNMKQWIAAYGELMEQIKSHVPPYDGTLCVDGVNPITGNRLY